MNPSIFLVNANIFSGGNCTEAFLQHVTHSACFDQHSPVSLLRTGNNVVVAGDWAAFLEQGERTFPAILHVLYLLHLLFLYHFSLLHFAKWSTTFIAHGHVIIWVWRREPARQKAMKRKSVIIPKFKSYLHWLCHLKAKHHFSPGQMSFDLLSSAYL